MPERDQFPPNSLLSELKIPDHLPEALRRVHSKGREAVVLAFSGGGALATVLIGVVGAFLEAGIPIDAVVGTSAGAIGAAIAAYVHSLPAWLEAKAQGESINWPQIAEFAYFAGGIFSFVKLARYINTQVSGIRRKNPKSYQPTPHVITTTDANLNTLLKNDPRLFYDLPQEFLGTIVQASCSVRFVIAPARVGSYLLWDGGVGPAREPVAVARAIAGEALVVSVLLTGNPARESPPEFRIGPGTRGKTFLGQAVFHPDNVFEGYLLGTQAVDQILALMAAREIRPSFRSGFYAPGQLLPYFSQRQIF